MHIEKNYNIILPYIKEQNDFCNNPKKYYNKLIEKNIILQKVNISGITYNMYIYKNKSFMTNAFKYNGAFEKYESINILKALRYFRKIKNIKSNKDIFMLDIGANIGWYPSFLGQFGYSILSFEPFETNYYILKKNYCLLNQNSNVIIITKGIDNEEKACDYYVHINNPGNGMIICEKSRLGNNDLDSRFKKLKKVFLTRLNNFLPYLSDKYIALIKIDIEGAEEKAIQSGIQLITIYHVPFVMIEFSPIYLKEHETDPMKFIRLFTTNGYKISLSGFLTNNFISEKDLMKITFQKNCYFIYEGFINK